MPVRISSVGLTFGVCEPGEGDGLHVVAPREARPVPLGSVVSRDDQPVGRVVAVEQLQDPAGFPETVYHVQLYPPLTEIDIMPARPSTPQNPRPRARRRASTAESAATPDQYQPHGSTTQAAAAEVVPQAPAVTAPERPHARVSPSKLKNHSICPAYEDDREEGTSASDEGHAMHALSEAMLAQTPPALSGLAPGALDEEQVGLVTECVDYVRGYLLPGDRVDQEVRLDCGPTWGYADVVVRHAARREGLVTASVFDYKYGRLAVEEAETNLQGWAYAVGVFRLHPEVDQVVVHFVCPRRDEASFAEFTRAGDLARLELAVEAVVAAASDPHPRERVDVENCRFCTRKGRCGALLDEVAVVSQRLSLPPTEADLDAALAAGPDDPDAVAVRLRVAKLLEGWARGTRDHALSLRLGGGVEIPGWSMRERRGNAAVEDVRAAFLVVQAHALAMGHSVTAEDFLRYCQVKPADAANAVASLAPRGEVTRVRNEVASALEQGGLVTRAPSTHYMAQDRE